MKKLNELTDAEYEQLTVDELAAYIQRDLQEELARLERERE